VDRLRAGPDIIANIIANGTNYTDKYFTQNDMVWWEGDDLTTPYWYGYADGVKTN